MHIHFKPRFFIFSSIVILLGGLCIFFTFTKKPNGPSGDNVLAAATKNDPYALLGGDAGGEVGGDVGSPLDTSKNISGRIEDYQPVTISYTVKEGDTLQSIAEKYHADAQTIADFPNNGLEKSLQLQVGQIIIIPNGYIDESLAPPLPPIAHGTGQFAWPAVGSITQYAYYWHPGALDIAVSLLTPIRAADDGKVITVEHFTTGYGVHVVIDHGDGLTSLYGHLTDTKMIVGQGIRKGDVIGLSGSTGHSTGPHLHFEVRTNGVPTDPMTLLPPQ